MLGIKLRSWMEAVRPKKKQQRKEKQSKFNLSSNTTTTSFTNSKPLQNTRSSQNNLDDMIQKSILVTEDKVPRYSGANLSSPESAYSTGYSTDGTSPGAPPEYYINIKSGSRYAQPSSFENKNYGSHISSYVSKSEDKRVVGDGATKDNRLIPSNDEIGTATTVSFLNAEYPMTCDFANHKNNGLHNNLPLSNGVGPKYKDTIANSVVMSPRQRNRIRTNPWVPANNISPGNSCVGLSHRPECTKSPVTKSSVSPRYCISTTLQSAIDRVTRSRQSLSSSSCSSLSTTASINWDLSLARHSSQINLESEDEDCTLNEMMGKYDESYVYEKETDILSDSDATDCETDIDTGQGSNGDQNSVQYELDYIDNGSYLEFNIDLKNSKNTGHCTYHNYEIQKKNSRKRTTRRSIKQEMQHQVSVSKQTNERRRRSNSSKKKFKAVEQTFNHPPVIFAQNTGSQSAGATPLSVRRTKQPLSKLVVDDNLRRRSNSVTFNSNSVHIINQKDKEADKKYRELINEADRLLTSMKSNNVLSPRRMPVPPNKRVELLRNAESSKSDAFVKNRLIDDTANLHLSRIPSNNFNPSRFSPVKNHITNFISNNSPVLMKKDISFVGSPLTTRKDIRFHSAQSSSASASAVIDKPLPPQTDVMLRKHIKYRKKANRSAGHRQYNAEGSCSSDSDDEPKIKHSEYCCPHSEPVKRKVYSDSCKMVTCYVNSESVCNTDVLNKSLFPKINTSLSRFPPNNQHTCGKGSNNNSSTENLRQQVLLNTIANLKRNLESQSASLRRVYRSSNSIRM